MGCQPRCKLQGPDGECHVGGCLAREICDEIANIITPCVIPCGGLCSYFLGNYKPCVEVELAVEFVASTCRRPAAGDSDRFNTLNPVQQRPACDRVDTDWLAQVGEAAVRDFTKERLFTEARRHGWVLGTSSILQSHGAQPSDQTCWLGERHEACSHLRSFYRCFDWTAILVHTPHSPRQLPRHTFIHARHHSIAP